MRLSIPTSPNRDIIGANPSFVRKLLVPLVQSKLLRSQMGKTGGVGLARPAAEITLRDIYGAVVADTKIWAPRTGIPRRCLVSSNVQGYFEELIDDAQDPPLYARTTNTARGPHRTGGSRECETSGSQPQPPVKEHEQRRLARWAADKHGLCRPINNRRNPTPKKHALVTASFSLELRMKRKPMSSSTRVLQSKIRLFL